MNSGGADNELFGEIAIYADWNEDLYFFDADGAAMDLTGLTVYFQFRQDPTQTNADVTLSTTAGTLSLQNDTGSVKSIVRIDVADGVFSSYEGDMTADLFTVDGSGDKYLYAHGIVTFRNNPVAI